jgi:hypothetical protein
MLPAGDSPRPVSGPVEAPCCEALQWSHSIMRSCTSDMCTHRVGRQDLSIAPLVTALVLPAEGPVSAWPSCTPGSCQYMLCRQSVAATCSSASCMSMGWSTQQQTWHMALLVVSQVCHHRYHSWTQTGT